MIVTSGSDALIPRFSAERNPKAAESLFWNSVWSAIAVSLILLVPFGVLVPDFLRLWINPEFALASGRAGQILALYLISQGAFSPVAAYFRGSGKPWFVSGVIASALVITVLSSIRLIPQYGVKGAAYAYLAGSGATFLGVIVGGIYAFRRSSVRLLRSVAVPIAAGLVSCLLGMSIRGHFGVLSWTGLFSLGALLLGVAGVLVVTSDLLLGGKSASSKHLLIRIATNRRCSVLLRWLPEGFVSPKPVGEA
jgi:Na+-driven multidrug efflux pump